MLSPSLSLKDRISSPLEAGHSIADGYQLPNRVTSALEYASKRLARKDTSVTLIAVQREYQLPANRLPPSSSLASPLWSQLRAEASGNRTPTRHTFASSAFSTLKQLIRSSVTTEPPIRERIVHIVDTRDTVISPALSDISASSASTASTALTSDSLFSSHRLRWPTTPAYDSEPPTPATPFTVASSMSMSATETGSTVSGLGLADEFGARFVYVGDLTPRDERVLSMTMEKTARKFSIGQDWLPTPLSPALLGLSPDVVQRSVAQNEVLFAADGLVVLSLDHLYTFRTALQSYASTRSATRLEDAVDELRRLVLASPGRRRLRKSALVGTYRWLEGVSEEALGDVVRMYGRAYGGDGGVEDDTVAPPLGVDVDVVAAGMEGEVVTPTVRSVKTGFGGGEGVVGPGEDSPRMVPPEEEKGEDDFEQGVGQPEMDAIEAWYRQPIRATIQQARTTTTDPYAPQPEEHHQPNTTPTAPLPSTPVPEPQPPLSNTTLPSPATPQPPSATSPHNHHTTPTPNLSPPPHPSRNRNRHSPLQAAGGGRERSPVLRLQTNFTSPSPRGSPQPVSALSFASSTTEGTGGSPVGLTPPTPEDLTTAPGSALWNGPMTPNGYDDISPITRGEWGFLMGGGAGAVGRQGGVGRVDVEGEGGE
ncbi:hypothetical protein QBC39DRAFT_267700 [Podospora conica]|nr:hypothetical protein QBC39DRAFT_267700 [Schizothecium conicum]